MLKEKFFNLSKGFRIMTVIIIVLICLAFLTGIYALSVNAYMVKSTESKILTAEESAELSDVDCILVLGAGVHGTTLSHMLEDRVKTGICLYELGSAPKILMSGDHGQDDYDEVNAMKAYAKECGVPSEDIFMDHAGFSTYESMYRARDIFRVKKVVIVTQKYHLYRAVYNARKLGLDAYGVPADGQYNYSLPVRTYNNSREALARCKDIIWCIFKPEPTYLGEAIPISSSGVLTDDKVN